MLSIVRNNSPYTAILIFFFALVVHFQGMLHASLPVASDGQFAYAWAVSYTHLDVYKRQIFNRAILTLILLFFLTSCDDKSGKSSSHANSLDNLISSQYPEIPTVYSQSFGQQCVFAINEIDAHALRSNRAVSYTHLDVYKRQVYE